MHYWWRVHSCATIFFECTMLRIKMNMATAWHKWPWHDIMVSNGLIWLWHRVLVETVPKKQGHEMDMTWHHGFKWPYMVMGSHGKGSQQKYYLNMASATIIALWHFPPCADLILRGGKTWCWWWWWGWSVSRPLLGFHVWCFFLFSLKHVFLHKQSSMITKA